MRALLTSPAGGDVTLLGELGEVLALSDTVDVEASLEALTRSPGWARAGPRSGGACFGEGSGCSQALRC